MSDLCQTIVERRAYNPPSRNIPPRTILLSRGSCRFAIARKGRARIITSMTSPIVSIVRKKVLKLKHRPCVKFQKLCIGIQYKSTATNPAIPQAMAKNPTIPDTIGNEPTEKIRR